METRCLSTATRTSAHLSWPGASQVLRLERLTLRNGQTHRTVSYAITSVDRSRASTADLLRWLRGRWAIENRSFWVRDVTLQEDHCRIRTGTAADTFSRIRNALINMMHAWGRTNMAAMLREHAWQTQRLFPKLGIFIQ